jgi:hypothetical protein
MVHRGIDENMQRGETGEKVIENDAKQVGYVL